MKSNFGLLGTEASECSVRSLLVKIARFCNQATEKYFEHADEPPAVSLTRSKILSAAQTYRATYSVY